jgi:mannosyl-oligosaccharide alpha-1,2-mannosidase
VIRLRRGKRSRHGHSHNPPNPRPCSRPPPTLRAADSLGGVDATAIESLSTLWLLGLHAEFNTTRDYIAKDLDLAARHANVSFFELTIRLLGGLLSAHDLSGDCMFLERARDLADRLQPAW